ncbi:MAG: hypothetical protein KBD21_00320 [Candidatus Pacebacteria bacterium]|nr:hypothetical protein [Candidatus Paceibacterota bacterium]
MKNNIFKLLAGVVGIYHVILGVSALVLPTDVMTKVVSTILGVVPVADEQFLLIAKYTGAYVFIFGILALLLASNPHKHRSLIYPILFLFGIRMIDRVLFFGSIAAISTSTAQIWFGTISIAFFFFGLLLTIPKKD